MANMGASWDEKRAEGDHQGNQDDEGDPIDPDKKSDQDDQDDMNDEALFHCAVYGVTNDLYCAFFLFLQINIPFV